MITADNITEEQIRALRLSVFVHEDGAADLVRTCNDALGLFPRERLTADAIGERIDHAKARCAEILNARAASPLDADGHIRECGNGGDDPRDCSPACARAASKAGAK